MALSTVLVAINAKLLGRARNLVDRLKPEEDASEA